MEFAMEQTNTGENMPQDNANICILCNTYFSDDPTRETVNVTAKGLDKLKSCSLERKDLFKERAFSKIVPPFRLHKDCRCKYTNKHAMQIYLKRKLKEEKLSSSAQAKTPRLRSHMETLFNPKKNCILCEKPLSDHPRKRQNQSLVSTIPFLENMKTVIKSRKDSIEGNDDWGNDVNLRLIGSDSDLVAGDGRYHRICYQYFYNNRTNPPGKAQPRGRPQGATNEVKQSAFEQLCQYIEDEEECQYSLQELKEIMDALLENGEEGYSLKMLPIKLKEVYGSEIVITQVPGKSSVACFKEFSHKILRDRWEHEKIDYIDKPKIIEMAAAYILDDIRTEVYDCETYPQFTDLNIAEKMVPETLQTFLKSIIKSKAKDSGITARKCCSIGHSIIAAARPRSFVSPILLAIAVYVHKNFESKELITILNKLGFADDYTEVRRLYAAFMSGEGPSYDLEDFCQFIFDNADFNVATLTGHSTFHSMGGIACVTPAKEPQRQLIPRSTKLPSAETIGRYGHVPIKRYYRPAVPGLKSTVITPLTADDVPPATVKKATALLCFWNIAFPSHSLSIPNWSGFMNSVIPGDNIQQSRLVILPFINLNPSDVTTIYSALCFAKSECDKRGIKFSPVTFDQPLYIKAAELIAATPYLSSVLFAVLGGFHMLMSYMGSIGYVMGGSGIEQLWEEVYAPASVNHMITGHAYSRALRAHVLTSAALTALFLESHNMNELSNETIASAARIVMNAKEDRTEIEDNQNVQQMVSQFDRGVAENENDSRTLTLWKQYLQQVVVLCLFIYSERSGDMELQKFCMQKMIPIFHAAGHLSYAKCTRLYLQQLDTLKEKVDENTYNNYMNGLFTVAGNFTDQTIEVKLMRLLKTSGGMVHGRGISDSTLAQFVHALPQTIPILQYIEELAGVFASTSEQHKDLRPTSKARDKADLEKLMEWLRAHSPCDYSHTEGLVALTSGVVADTKINCERAYSISTSAANAITGQQFTAIKLKLKDKVVTFSSHRNKIHVRGQTVELNPTLLFYRITCILNNSAEMEMYLTYELSPYPTSLFKDGILRKNDKSDLTSNLKQGIEPIRCIEELSIFIIDGGYLLRKCVWDSKFTFKEVCLKYIKFIHDNIGMDVTVVFDGYNSLMSTKRAEQRRRASKGTSPDILFDEHMKPTTSQEAFMTNSNNKSRLINMLRHYCAEANIDTLQAEGDADPLIVSTALKLAEPTKGPVVVVGSDADLVSQLTATSETNTRIHIMLETNPVTIYKIADFQTKLNEKQRKQLNVVHCLTGCDTTSALYGKGKQTAMKVLKELSDEAADQMSTFLAPCEDVDKKKEEISAVGELFLLKLYASKTATSLNKLRYIIYNMKLKGTKVTSAFLLETLPPTTAAAKQHSYRAYHTVQQCLGNDLNPLDWGWALSGNDLIPVYTDKQVAPDRLLKMVSCGCKGGCVKNCSCVKLEIFCSVMCSHCNGQLCKNTPGDSPNDDNS